MSDPTLFASLRSWRDSGAGEGAAEPLYSLAKPARESTIGEGQVNPTRLFTNPLTASPLVFTASVPKQKHSRASYAGYLFARDYNISGPEHELG